MATILIVDDHPTNRKLVATQLLETDHKLIEASDGEEALDAIDRHRPDLVVSDIMLPKVDGFQLVLRLRANPALPQPPFVFLTSSYLEVEAKQIAEAFGVTLFLTRPIKGAQLLEAIDLALAEPQPGMVNMLIPPDVVERYLRLVTCKLCRQVDELNLLNQQLDKLVAERTAELAAANTALMNEAALRKETEKALRQVNLHLGKLALNDPLTGLYNRRYMEASLNREVSRALREQALVAVLMMDIDHFKHYNDTYGHLAGDAVLVAVSKYLRSTTRAEDVLCRYGGEEFLLAMTGIPREVVWERAETLRTDVQRVNMRHQDRDLPQVTLSIGIAYFPEHGGSAAEVVAAADHALYQAKEAGRNHCNVFVASGQPPII